LGDTAAADGYDGKFRAGKKSVGQNEQQDDDEFEPDISHGFIFQVSVSDLAIGELPVNLCQPPFQKIVFFDAKCKPSGRRAQTRYI
jgi:hypothetical protein